MFKKLFEHNITSHEGQFFCYVCMIVRSDLEDVLHHITEEKHLLLQSKQTNNVLKDYAEQTCRTLVANNIGIITLSSFYCIVCQCNFTDLISTLLHARSRYHINQLKKYYVDINYDKDKSKTCIISLMSELLRVKKKKLASFDKSLLIKDMYQDCNLNVSKGYHELQFFRTFHNYSNEDCKILVNNGILKINYYELMCQYCYRCCPTVDDILQHVKATKHIFDLTENDIILNKEECKQNEYISVNSELMKTIMNLNVSKMKQTGESTIIDLLKYISIKTQQEQDTNVNEKLLRNDLICKLCTCHLPSFDHILQHVIGKQHVNLLMYTNNKLIYSTKQNNNENEKLDLLQEVDIDTFSEKLEINYDHIFLSNKIIIEESNFQCTLCPRKIDTLHNTLQHIDGKCHTNKLKYFDNSSNTSKIDYALSTNFNNDGSAFQEVNTDIFSEKLEIKDCQSNFKSNIDYNISSSSHMNYLKNYDHIFLSNKIIIEESNFLCILCPRKIDTLHNTLQHIEGKCHTKKLKYLDKSYNNISLSSHMNDLENYDHIFLSNKIIIEESNFLCILCPRKIDTLHNTLQHIEGKCHTNKLKYLDKSYNNISLSSHMNYLENYNHIFLSNKITIQESNFLCILCTRKIDTLHNTLQHIEGKCHTEKLKYFDNSSNTSKINYDLCTNFNNNELAIQNLTTNFVSSEMKEKVVTVLEMEDNDSNAIIFNECLYYCELCGIQININNVNKHINALIHKNKIPAISTEYDMFIYKCFCCKSIIQGTSLLINHLNSAKHLNNSTNTLRHIKANNIEIFTKITDNIRNMLKDTKSSLCNFIFPEFGSIPMNSLKKQFMLFDVSNIVIYNNIKNKIVFFCSICSTTSDTPHKLSSSCKSFPTITNNYNVINYKSINYSIIPNDIKTEMMTLIYASPFKTNTMTKHIYKEERPVKHLNKIYCERYLQIEEIMYILDKRKLDNIKLNFELFMPYNAKQFYCLACNINVSKDLDLLYEHACLKPHKMKVNDIENDKSHGELLKQYMQKISSDFVKCHICRSCIRNDTNSIDAHMNDMMHKKQYNNFRIIINNTFNSVKQILSNLWYSIEKFSCVLCSINFKYKIQFIEHIITVHNNLLLNQMFDFCIPCATLWLNWSDCYTEHCNDVTHKYLIKNKDFMIEDLPECIKKLLRQVDKTVDILFQETQILVNDNARKEIEQSLKNILNSSFPFIKLYLFGSRINELGSANSVIDIFLDCGSTYYSDHKKWLRNGNLEIIEEIIRKQRNEWEVKEGRRISRTAIKLLYKPARVQCDVFITNTLSIKNFELIRSFNDLYPPCSKLILFIEKWLSCFDLPSRHGLINYAIAWLVIFYLQLNSDLPSVATLIQKKSIYKLMYGPKIDVVQPKNSKKSVQSISLLLLGFFQFYANFDYQHYIICPLMGYAVAKKAFVNLDTLPKEMKTYINHIRESNNPEYLRIDSPLCIQDPLDLSRNLTRTVNSITLKYFKQYCQDSAYILRQSSVRETNNAN